MINRFIVVFSTLLLSVTTGQVIQNGQCSDLNTSTDDFNLDDLLGSWYEVLRTPNVYQEGHCSILDFIQNSDDPSVITLSNTAYNSNFKDETVGLITKTGPGTLLLNSITSSQSIEILVLLFVPNSIAIGYNCLNINENQRSVTVWTMGKQTEHSVILQVLVAVHLGTLGLTLADMEQVDHSELACYGLPEIDAGNSIILPGFCDLDIPVQQNFDLQRFTGEWHQIYSYYSENNLGTCGKAVYTLFGNFVTVLNSEIVDQTLQTVSGIATSIDNAKFRIALEVSPGVIALQDVWVLSTDYDNYAVLYSCENLPGNQKQVWSWINSRSSDLSTSAQAAVNETVNSLMELSYRYYTETQRSNEACFYYPEPSATIPPVFPGQCDETIEAAANFDISQYAGTWYEIITYPQGETAGECIIDNFTADVDNNLLDLYTTSVRNQTLTVSTGTLTFGSTDGSAKMYLTFSTGITIPFWILSTDYVDYSFAYSCVNRDATSRVVYSWKLSRTKELSTAATQAIAEVMSPIDVLDERYFIDISQSDEDCYYV